MMAKHRNLLIVLADGEHARFVRPAGDNALHSDSAFDSVATHKRSGDLGTDQPGAAYHTNSTAHHVFAPRHDPHDLEKQKFAQAVGQDLNAAAAAGGFAEVILVAPPHVLADIRGALDTATGARVIGTLAKDLVKIPDDQLQPHLKEWVLPVHRPQG